MQLSDAVKLVEESNGSHLYEIFIPSVSKNLKFKPITTGQQKTLSKFSMDAKDFNLGYELLKLGLFDSLKVGDKDITSEKLTEIDMIAFICGLRYNNISDPLDIRCKCSGCNHEFNHNIKLEDILTRCQEHEAAEYDFDFVSNEMKYDLVITTPTYKNLIELEEYVKQMSEKLEFNKEDETDFRAFNKPATFIKTAKINGIVIDDFDSATLIDKLKFYNSLPPKITFNSKKSILNLILDEFDLDAPKNMMGTLNCPKCKKQMEGVLTNDNFFII